LVAAHATVLFLKNPQDFCFVQLHKKRTILILRKYLWDNTSTMKTESFKKGKNG
jgi:hypothetical protein